MKLKNMKRTKRGLISILMIISIMLTFASCSEEKSNTNANESNSILIDKDREGNEITLPDSIETVISMGPSNTEILVALGLADKIIAADTYSANVEGIKGDIPMFDMLSADAEQIISLNPDIIFVTGMTKEGGEEAFSAVSNAGISILYIPSSTSINEIKSDIKFIADVMNVADKGEEIIANMEKEIDAIKAIGDTITDKKSVYFEISAAPYMYSFGNGVFLDEMINIIGAENAMKAENSWIAVADEQIFAVNPDVILTCVNYIENPTEEIKSRAGWEELNAVKNNEVYYIDSDASNRPSHNIIKALKDMAKCVYPELY